MINYDQDYVDFIADHKRDRLKARIAHRHRLATVHGRMEESARGSGRPGAQGGTTAPRSLPSGPALNPTGFAIALLLLGVIALFLGFGVIAWAAFSLLRGLGNLGSKDGV